MAPHIKKLVLLAVMLVMPLQGIAATLSVLLCHGDAQAHAMHAQDGHDHGMYHDGHQDESGTTGSHAGHFCSHLVVSGLPEVILPAITPDLLVQVSASHLLHDSHFPDRPQRPPLA